MTELDMESAKRTMWNRLSYLIPRWDLTSDMARNHRVKCIDWMIARGLAIGTWMRRDEVHLRAITPGDFGLDSWEIPSSSETHLEWIQHTTRRQEILVVFSVVIASSDPSVTDIIIYQHEDMIVLPVEHITAIAPTVDRIVEIYRTSPDDLSLLIDSSHLSPSLIMEGYLNTPIRYDPEDRVRILLKLDKRDNQTKQSVILRGFVGRRGYYND